MKRLLTVLPILLLISASTFSYEAVAQDPESTGVEVTFGKQDLLNAMKDDEREEFLELREKLKQLSDAAKNGGLEPAVREASAMLFRTTKDTFEQKFGVYRGFRDKTVIVHGNPPPDKREIMAVVIGNGGISKSPLHPHWTRDSEGAIVGTAVAPVFDTPSVAAGVDSGQAFQRPSGGGESADQSSGGGESADQYCRAMAGPLQSQNGYEKLSNPGCYCNPSSLLGLPECIWSDSNPW